MITWQEKDIEDYICENVEELFGENFLLLGRQINIGIGVLDVLLYDRETFDMVVVEIKKDAICNQGLVQILKYIQGVEDYIYGSDIGFSFFTNEIRGILMGPDMRDDTKTVVRLLEEYVGFMEIDVSIVIKAENVSFSRNEENESYRPESFIALLEDVIGDKNGDI